MAHYSDGMGFGFYNFFFNISDLGGLKSKTPLKFKFPDSHNFISKVNTFISIIPIYSLRSTKKGGKTIALEFKT